MQLTQNLQKRSAGKVVNSKTMNRLYRPNVMSIIDSDPRFSNNFIFPMILVGVLLIFLVPWCVTGAGIAGTRGFLVSWPALNQEALVQMG